MKRLAIISLISVVALSGCTGTGSAPMATSLLPTTTSGGSATGGSATGGSATANMAGNWQFSATSSSPQARPFSMAGAINQSNAIAGGAVHIDRPDCFDPL